MPHGFYSTNFGFNYYASDDRVLCILAIIVFVIDVLNVVFPFFHSAPLAVQLRCRPPQPPAQHPQVPAQHPQVLAQHQHPLEQPPEQPPVALPTLQLLEYLE